jgi:CheY-like chemotaxis protein
MAMAKLVVIADDIEMVRTTLRHAIESLYPSAVAAGELAIVTCADGEDVLTTCLSANPDLIIMDVDMPRRDGISAFYALKGMSGALASSVVFLTGHAGSPHVDERVRQAVADGACGVLPKPTTAADLRSLLDSRVFAR